MSETALQIVVAAYLDFALPPGATWTSIDAGGVKLSAAQASLRQRRGIKPGWPDVLVLHGGRLFGLELKTARGRLSDAQKAARADIEAAGGVYAVCRSVADVEEALRPHMPLRATMGTRFQPRRAA